MQVFVVMDVYWAVISLRFKPFVVPAVSGDLRQDAKERPWHTHRAAATQPNRVGFEGVSEQKI